MFRIILALIVTLVVAAPGRADLADLMKAKGRKILFLGDSNTYSGLYIAYVEGYLRTRFPAEEWELINLGLPSETVSGLSEPDHPYPRPDVHERIDRALEKVKPNVVFVCYGMNDGIYYPFAEERLKKYREGTEKLVAKIEKAGAKVVLMTPAPFDPLPVAKNLLPKGAAKYSWMKPYEKYDEALRKYSDYLLEWRKKDYTVIDAHAAVQRHLKAMREKEPKYVVSGDGIHPNATGHAVIAFEILRALKAPPALESAEVDFKARKLTKGTGVVRDFKKDSLDIEWKGRWPMPTDPAWNKRLNDVEPGYAEFNRIEVKITGLPEGKYEIVRVMDGRKPNLKTASSDQLAKGIAFTDLALDEKEKKLHKALGEMIRARQRASGSAWLTDVGHKRPDTPKSLPLKQVLPLLKLDELQIRHVLEMPIAMTIAIGKAE